VGTSEGGRCVNFQFPPWGRYAELEITADHRSMIGKKLLMIGGKAGFPTWVSKPKAEVDNGKLRA
jgi:hypothetical protein